MTRTKKVLGLLLALAMVFGCMTVAFATDPGADARAATVTVATTATELAAGETATITVSATTNFTASTASIPVFYNKTLVSVSDVATVSDVIGTAIVTTDATAEDSDLVYANTGYSADEYGFVLVQYTADNGEEIAATLSNVALVTFTVTALADVEGDATVVVPATALKTTSNYNGKLYFGCETGSDSEVTVVPELVSNIDTTAATQTITIGSAEPADLALTDAGSTAGVIIDTNKTFGGAYAGVVYGFEQAAAATFRSTTYLTNNLQVTNEGSWTLGRSIGTAGYGTGTTIEILNADGTSTGKIYVVVIFADVNGDGLINANDTKAANSAVSDATVAPTNSVKRLAANCQSVNAAAMMHTLNANDVKVINNYVSGSKFTPADLAAKHASYNTYYQ